MVRPLVRRNQADKTHRQHQSSFSSLSINESNKQLLEKASALLRRRRFSRVDSSTRYSARKFTRIVNSHADEVYVSVDTPVLKKAISNLAQYKFLIFTDTSDDEEVSIDHFAFLVTRKSVRSTKLMEWLPSFEPIADRVIRRNPPATKPYEPSMTIAVVDSVKSVEDFAERFRKLIDNAALV